MATSPNHPAATTSPWRRFFLAVMLMAGVGGLLLLVARYGRPPSSALPEAHRNTLEQRDGRWYVPGQSNGFIGLLLGTYDDGTMKSRSAISNGLLQGLSEGWYTNGQMQVREHFVAGISHGLRTKWHPSGQKLSEVTILDGKLHGTFRSWHDNGERAEEVELQSGQPEGISRSWFPSGSLKSQVTLQNGKVVNQQFWKDGEYSEVTTAGP